MTRSQGIALGFVGTFFGGIAAAALVTRFGIGDVALGVWMCAAIALVWRMKA